jgi:hypothetical protein
MCRLKSAQFVLAADGRRFAASFTLLDLGGFSMTRLSWLIVPSVAVVALISACESASVTSPRAPMAASMNRSDASSLS